MVMSARQKSISVVIPAYNCQRTIEQTVRSVLNQLAPHHELIIVDDGSSDNTLALLLKLHESWTGANVHVFSQPRAGIASARNHLLRVAQGDYIAFLDGDDVLLPGALSAMDRGIAAHRPDVMACDFRLWTPHDPAATRSVRLGYPVGKVVSDQDTILRIFFADRQMYIWSNVFRREIYAQLGPPVFPPEQLFEDVSTVPRLLSQCATLLHLPHPVIDSRQLPALPPISAQWCIDFASALPLAKRHLHQRGVGVAVRQHFDIAAAYFYVGVVKNTYRLPRAEGKRVRALLKPIFAGSLFGDTATMVATAGADNMTSNDRTLDAVIIRQVASALGGGVVTNFKRGMNRKLKLWRRLRQARRHAGSASLSG
jgi:glycosyltransferase involved in cell wall biosynthesis